MALRGLVVLARGGTGSWEHVSLECPAEVQDRGWREAVAARIVGALEADGTRKLVCIEDRQRMAGKFEPGEPR